MHQPERDRFTTNWFWSSLNITTQDIGDLRGFGRPIISRNGPSRTRWAGRQSRPAVRAPDH